MGILLIIISGKGIRHFFIICTKGLSLLLKRAESRGDIHRIKVCRRTPSFSLSYLLMIVFYFATQLKRKQILLCTSLTYMRKLLTNKLISRSLKFFSIEIQTSQWRTQSCNQLASLSQLGSIKYLGLLSIIRRSKKLVFGFLKDKLWNSINHWSTKHLSKTGKEVFIESCDQVIPSYCMSVFFPPIHSSGWTAKSYELILVGQSKWQCKRNTLAILGSLIYEKRVWWFGVQTSLWIQPNHARKVK